MGSDGWELGKNIPEGGSCRGVGWVKGGMDDNSHLSTLCRPRGQTLCHIISHPHNDPKT